MSYLPNKRARKTFGIIFAKPNLNPDLRQSIRLQFRDMLNLWLCANTHKTTLAMNERNSVFFPVGRCLNVLMRCNFLIASLNDSNS